MLFTLINLFLQAIRYHCPFVQGATMLLEQGIEQFELWHKRTAPSIVMQKTVFQGTEKLQ